MRLIQSAVFKLTLWYLGIIMVLCLLFSMALYRASADQLIENTDRQRNAIAQLPLPLSMENRRTQYLQNLYDELDAGRHNLVIRLTLLNVIMLLLGGGGAYWLARRTLRPIQESLEAQGRFTADASHELRTPLTAMRAEIEVALRDKQLGAAEARGLLGSNLEEIAKLEALSAGLLRLARFETGLDEAGLEIVTVSQLYEAAIDRLSGALHARRINLDVTDSDAGLTGDRASLTELIAVLLDNAVKYSPEGSTIHLDSQVSAQHLTLRVADEGVGIKASDIPHIFDRFYRADRSRSKEQVNGYGLGLSIARRIALLHHGTISVESTPGQGTAFSVKLPRVYQPKKRFFG